MRTVPPSKYVYGPLRSIQISVEDIVGIISDSAEDPEIVECESNSIVYVGVSEIMKNANNISSPCKFEFDGITMELSDVGVSINSTREQEAVVLTIINSLGHFKSIWVWWGHPLVGLVVTVCLVLIVSVFFNYLANFFGESTADTEFVILFFLAAILTLLLIWPVFRVIDYLLSSKVTRKKNRSFWVRKRDEILVYVLLILISLSVGWYLGNSSAASHQLEDTIED